MTAPARHVVAVGSGKGGVGKSTVALNLALALGERRRVGLLDADLYGPDIPLMVGVRRGAWREGWTLAKAGGPKAQPRFSPEERFGLQIASAGFFFGEDQPLGFEPRTAEIFIRQLLYNVTWAELDVLVIDLPPGTSAVQHLLAKAVALSGAVLVVTPQDVAHLDARKSVQLLRSLKVPILGGVENMATLVCPHCAEVIPLGEVAAGRSIWDLGVARLGTLPFLVGHGAAADSGRPLLVDQPGSATAAAYRVLADRLWEALAPG